METEAKGSLDSFAQKPNAKSNIQIKDEEKPLSPQQQQQKTRSENF